MNYKRANIYVFIHIYITYILTIKELRAIDDSGLVNDTRA